ncbi:MAG: acyl-CoA dehydrogenase family protein [Bryobacterales bacterium]|nr:acyl-CoA dehydrogenase family protein [Bryobacterales bacterium]
MPGTSKIARETLKTLPGDEVRQILWRLTDRYDLQMLVQSARGVARGPVARLVAGGARNTHEWTPEKNSLLKDYDAAGTTGVFLDPAYGGYLEGPKNLAMALVAFELAWVDGGAATASLASGLALAPIHERGTVEQKNTYMQRCSPTLNAEPLRGAFCLTEPLPYVGVETGLLSGKVRIAEWKEGEEPWIEVDKRGRFITNMGFANFVTAAVSSGDPRIKGSCMVILEESDEGTFDRGAPTKKLVHQLSSTTDPVFKLKVPANRIIGGYTVKDGVIIPNFDFTGEIIEAVFRRTRVTVGLMTAAKLLSAIEPLLRYHRDRFRGGEGIPPGTPRYELGLQQKEDVLHRVLEVWSNGEAAASLGFETARLFDELDPLEKEKDEALAAQGVGKGMATLKAMRRLEADAVELLRLESRGGKDGLKGAGDEARLAELRANPLLHYMHLDSVANVLCPATKLWNTGHGANELREAVSLMGGYGITEDCPGFLIQKWTDAQLEATYEGPEAVQRRQLSLTMTNEVFLAQFQNWIRQLRQTAGDCPESGACALATAMELWLWSLRHLLKSKDARWDATSYQSARQGVSFPMADALCWLLSARQLILDVRELDATGADNPAIGEGFAGLRQFYFDLCTIQSARTAGEVGRICAELVFGYNRHPRWDDDGPNCYGREELIALESIMPGMSAMATSIVVEMDGSHPPKAGSCVSFQGYEQFRLLRTKMDGCITGSQLAKDRAAQSLVSVMIPAALDYPV